MLELYTYLALGWLAFCSLHSIMATLWFKAIVKTLLGKHFKYYQLLYSLFFFIFLVLLLKYQFQLSESLLFPVNNTIKLLATLTFIGGLLIMISASIKYFAQVTGMKILRKNNFKDEFIYSGMNSVIRHPLYAGTLVSVWSLLVFSASASSLIVCIIITLYVLIGIKFEEKKLMIKYGETYKKYISRVPMLVPAFKLRNKSIQ
jgi:methanethiol S-methyltransferase